MWPAGRTPPDIPVCGYEHELCKDQEGDHGQYRKYFEKSGDYNVISYIIIIIIIFQILY